VTGIAGRVGERARRLHDQVLSAAERHSWLEVGIAVVRRDIDVGGTMLAGALGFRLFVWLLPCSLLLAAAAGFGQTAGHSPEELTRDLGMSPLTASMLGQVGAQAERGRYVTAIVGLVLLAWAGVALGRTMDRVHERVWRRRGDRRAGPTMVRFARYSGVLLLLVVLNIAMPALAAVTGQPPALVSLPSLVCHVLIGILLLSARWPPLVRATWPGAVLLALGLEGLHLVAVLYLPGKLARASELYGTLGVAAAVLVWLALMTRLLVLGQVLNAVLAEREPAR
jgi:uncharacterized BrkB/YihY/UPF0761 family membrane protein